MSNSAVSLSPDVLAHFRHVDGGVTAPLGFGAGAPRAASSGTVRAPIRRWISRSSPRPLRLRPRRCSRRTRPWPRPSWSRASIWRPPADARAPSSSTAAARTRARATPASRSRVRWPRRGRTRVGCRAEEVLVASTGVIGVPLDIAKIRAGVAAIGPSLNRTAGEAAARAIMTTDPFPKSCAVVVDLPEGTITVGGMAKGSGMIEPRMATMLGFLTTDAEVAPGRAGARAAARRRTRRSTPSRSTASARRTTASSRSHRAARASSITRRRRPAPRRAAHGRGRTPGARDRARRRRRDQARHRSRHRRGVAGRRVAGGADDRELAARQDGHSRRRSRTGAAWSRPPDDRARRSISIARRFASATSRSSWPASRTTSARTRRPPS